MFWNDPNLYTANVPYKEFGTFPHKDFGFTPQVPFVGQQFNPWQSIPRVIPQTYGTLPYLDPRMVLPFMQAQLMHPFMHTQVINPGFTPYNVNLPFYNMYRPFTY